MCAHGLALSQAWQADGQAQAGIYKYFVLPLHQQINRPESSAQSENLTAEIAVG
jgi:hypothetical protein